MLQNDPRNDRIVAIQGSKHKCGFGLVPRHGDLMLHTPAYGKVLLADEVSAYPDPPVVADNGIRLAASGGESLKPCREHV